MPNSKTQDSKMTSRVKLGPPVLRIKDLDLILPFYSDIFGLQVNRRYQNKEDDLETLEMGFKGRFRDSLDPLLILKVDPKAKSTPHNFAGLFHFAILVPDRRSLGIACSTIERKKVRFDGFADHLVSESLYLHDPERNGIEIYRDRPSSEWPRDKEGHIIMDTLPLDLAGVLALSDSETYAETFPSGARIGHMHLRVTNLEKSVKFYHEKLGLDISADWSQMGAMFLSYGGYHHHLGMNTWHSFNGKHHEKGEAGLDAFTIEVPDDDSYLNSLKLRLESSEVTRGNEREFLISDPDCIPLIIKPVAFEEKTIS